MSCSLRRFYQKFQIRRIAQLNYSNAAKEPNKPIELPKRRESNVGKRGPITWKNLMITGVLGSGMVAYLFYLKEEQDEKQRRERKKQLGKAKIGGPFELVDGSNNIVKSEQFLGKWMLIYFGFSHCPDICPDELEKMALVIDNLEKQEMNTGIQGIFITVDPERDSPKIVEKYIKEFSPKFIGLSGTSEQIQNVCKKYRVYYSPGKKDLDNDYIVSADRMKPVFRWTLNKTGNYSMQKLCIVPCDSVSRQVDHTIIMYLVNPEGEFIDYFGQNKTAEEIVEHILMHMFKFNQEKGTLLTNTMDKINALTSKTNIF